MGVKMDERMKTWMIAVTLLLPAVCSAQQLRVKSLEIANEIIVSSDRKTDWDNELCAIVKIQGAELDSISGAFDVTRRGAELWAYATQGTRRLTLYKRGYDPLVIDFRQYGLTEGTKSNRVYRLTVHEPQASNRGNTQRVSVSHAMTTASIDVGSNKPWTVTTSVPWISAEPASGDGDGAFTATIQKNTGKEERTGDIVIKTETMTRTIIVIQSPPPQDPTETEEKKTEEKLGNELP